VDGGSVEGRRSAGSPRRDHRIDVLRGASILVVLILHFNLAYNLVKSPFSAIFSERVVNAIVWNGNYGVTIFFVISGFLITSTSLRRFGSLGQVSAKAFYAFRVARIFPCLFLILPVITILAIARVPFFASNKPVSLWLATFSVLTFWHNVLMANVGYFNYGLNVLWSLSVEEVFYIVFPLLCLALRKPRWIVPVWIAAIIYGPIYRSRHLDNEILYLYAYFACFDAIALGCCMAVLAKSVRVSRALRNIVQAAAALTMAAVYVYKPIGDNAVWGPTIMAVGAAAFLLVEGASRDVVSSSGDAVSAPVFLISRPIAWMGKHSYELYLFHIIVLAAMRNVIARRDLAYGYKPLWFFLFMALSLLVAWLIARFYSEPLNANIRKLLSGRQTVPAR
jgi:peptidoglycan/LPS O-acetylase OafA/YrhL